MRTALLFSFLCLLAAGCRPQNSSVPAKPVAREVLQDMEECIELHVAAGFMTEEEIVTSAVEYASENYDAATLTPHAEKITKQKLAVHLSEQANWPAVTDCDRLDAAFAALEGKGIVCRQDFSCCGTCGSGEIWDEMDQTQKKGVHVRGYAFYHMQDTESAVVGDGLYISYGSKQDTEPAAIAIAQEISEALKQQGLKTDWDGTWKMRIGVKLDWKKRRKK
jgi:hypothetical protein